MAAASKSSWGMPCRPARKRITAKPMYFQVMMSINDQMAILGSDSQSTVQCGSPALTSRPFTAPLVWSPMLQTNGAVNGLLIKAGLPHWTVDWLSDPKIAIWSLMLIITWKYIGFAVILFLAGLQSIPEELFEAAAIDGASYWQTQRRITVPLLGPTIRIWAFLSMIGALQLFDLVYIIWGQYVAATAGTSTMATYMVVNGRNAANYGFGNAVAVVLFLISLVLALTYQRFVLRRDTEGALTEGKK